MIVTILGTGSPLGTPVLGCACPTCKAARERGIERTRSGIHLRNERTGEVLLIDAGPDVRRQLADGSGGVTSGTSEKSEAGNVNSQNGDRELPDAVLITHVHFDHCAGLDELTHYREPLPVYAADATGLRVPEPNAGASVAGVLGDRFGYAETLSVRGRTPHEAFETCGFAITLAPVDHGSIACYGLRVEDPTTGAVLVFTSDTSYAIPERSRATFRDPDLLIAQSLVPASLEGEWPTDRAGRRASPTWNHHDADGRARSLRGAHLTETGALALSEDLGAERTRLTHASHYYPVDRAFDDPLARDGERFVL